MEGITKVGYGAELEDRRERLRQVGSQFPDKTQLPMLLTLLARGPSNSAAPCQVKGYVLK